VGVATASGSSNAAPGPHFRGPTLHVRGHVPAGRLRPVGDATVPGTAAFAGLPLGITALPAAGVNFLGMGSTSTNAIITGDPPDPTGAVGPSNYVQAVNGGIQIYNKAGTVLKAAAFTNTLWTGYAGTNAGNGCATRNDGDAIVRYDRLADRWLISQFSLPNSSSNTGPSFQCVAVSKTGDPTGAYWAYSFDMTANRPADYPHMGVWHDG